VKHKINESIWVVNDKTYNSCEVLILSAEVAIPLPSLLLKVFIPCFRRSRRKRRLCYLGHLLMENRNGLAVNARVTEASGRAERQAAMDMLGDLPGKSRVTVGGDKAYDTKEFVSETRGLNVTPHVAQSTKNRASAIDDRTTHHAGYPISQRKRKRVEEIFGWLKTVGFLRKTRHRGTDRVGWMFTFGVDVYNRVRMRNMMEAPA
jgi:hypothetical protein